MKNNKGIIITIAAVIAVIVVVIIGVCSFTSRAIAYEEKVTEARSGIKVQEKRREELYKTLADAIKSYDKHEAETLLNVVSARKSQDGVITDKTVNEINTMLDVLVEAYPQLQSEKNYEKFMNESSITENMIAEARDAYNSTVSRYNSYTKDPVNKFFLSLTGYEKEQFEKLDYDVSEDAPTNLFD